MEFDFTCVANGADALSLVGDDDKGNLEFEDVQRLVFIRIKTIRDACA